MQCKRLERALDLAAVVSILLLGSLGCGDKGSASEEEVAAENPQRRFRVLRDPGPVTRPPARELKDLVPTLPLPPGEEDAPGEPTRQTEAALAEEHTTESQTKPETEGSPTRIPPTKIDARAAAEATENVQGTREEWPEGDLNPPPKKTTASIVTPKVPVTPVSTASALSRKVPDDPYDPNCLNAGCHDDLKKTDRVHGPISVGICDPCHAPNPPGHHFKPTRAQPELCTFCHLTAAEKKVVHTPMKKEPCTTCHTPHGSKSKFLLVQATTAENCASCHNLPKGEFTHGPLSVGECTACHEAHQSDHPGLLHEPAAQLCLKCHNDTAQAIASKKYAHKPATQDCTSCHLSHYGSDRFFLRRPNSALCLECHEDIKKLVTEGPVVHGAVKELEECSNCHTAHASDRPFQLRSESIKLCLQCHDKEVETPQGTKLKNIAAVLANSKFQHGPIREGDCLPCHNTHASVNSRLLKQVFPEQFYEGFDVKNYALCFTCHQQTLVLHHDTTTLTGFRDGTKNLHFAHVHKEVKGRTCRACHEIHASNLPKHMRKDVPFGGSGWMLPINHTKTETGGACTPGCHKTKRYDRAKGGAPP